MQTDLFKTAKLGFRTLDMWLQATRARQAAGWAPPQSQDVDRLQLQPDNWQPESVSTTDAHL